MKELFLATRPWSFTATLVPILVTAGVTGSSFATAEFARALAMGIFIHSGANLTNTYFDYVNGVDTKQHNADSTLVDKKLQPSSLLTLSFICYFLGTAAVLPLITFQQRHDIALVFSVGLVLAFFYTANPVGLKYRALGDITIFLCFGPLLMQCTSLILTGSMKADLSYYTVPIGLLTEAILHSNNARDIKTDAEAGAVTLANMMGFKYSYYLYIFLIYGAFASATFIALFFRFGCLLPLLTLPLGTKLVYKFQAKDMATITEETAQFHLPFGLLLFAGVMTTSQGLVSFL